MLLGNLVAKFDVIKSLKFLHRLKTRHKKSPKTTRGSPLNTNYVMMRNKLPFDGRNRIGKKEVAEVLTHHTSPERYPGLT